MNLSLIIRAFDKASGPISRVAAASKALAKSGLGAIAAAGGGAEGSIAQLVARGTEGLKNLGAAAARAAGSAGLGALKIAAKGAALGVAGIAGAAAFGAGKFIGDVISTTSKFEQFQVVLENTEGSAAKARAAMAWVKNFAKTTPYEIGEVMDAFVKMRAYGIDPTQGALASLGNAASGMGKDLGSAIEMIADAQTGEFERLKEFGIKAKQAGDEVTFSWSKNGKDMTRTSKKSASDIRKTITGIFDDNFGGMMDRQSGTLVGMWSNIKDMVSNFALDVGNAGFFDFVKGKVAELLAWVNKLAASGALQKWAQKISDALVVMATKAIDFVENIEWGAAAQRIGEVATALGNVVTALGQVISWGKSANDSLNWLSDLPSKYNVWDMLQRNTGIDPFNVKPQFDKLLGRNGGGTPQAKPGQPVPGSRGQGGRPAGPIPTEYFSKPRGPVKTSSRVDLHVTTDAGSRVRVASMSSDSPNNDVRVHQGRRGPVGMAA
jgi:phage tail tape-measure protein